MNTYSRCIVAKVINLGSRSIHFWELRGGKGDKKLLRMPRYWLYCLAGAELKTAAASLTSVDEKIQIIMG
jgi:hypothetical protein